MSGTTRFTPKQFSIYQNLSFDIDCPSFQRKWHFIICTPIYASITIRKIYFIYTSSAFFKMNKWIILYSIVLSRMHTEYWSCWQSTIASIISGSDNLRQIWTVSSSPHFNSCLIDLLKCLAKTCTFLNDLFIYHSVPASLERPKYVSRVQQVHCSFAINSVPVAFPTYVNHQL